MRIFWENLAAREKALIGIAGALLVFVLGWQLALKPLLAYPDVQKTKMERARSDLEIMRKGQLTLKGQNITGAGSTKTSLSAADVQSKITKSAAAHGLLISRRQPNGDDGVSLWFEHAQSTQFYTWIEELTSTYDIILLRANLNRNENGTVRVQVTFKLGT